MRPSLFIISAILFSSLYIGCQAQDETSRSPLSSEIVGGGCDGCELMYVGMPNDIRTLSYSPNWVEVGQKIHIKGTVVKRDGKTLAQDVIIYYWQTDTNGLYSSGLEKSTVHGKTRGWVKSDSKGKFDIFSLRPAPYPDLSMPSHIHLAVKEPDIDDEYYVDEIVFDDDPLLTAQYRESSENRGGSGILQLAFYKELQVAEHKIILGLNIPNYPELK